ncbi:hypothetical protein SDC9_182020 [bioreactor metagenome]|uniref:Uncharacterized protein n=1 Tax=bioreactor metagenome TaxID=1076179 RepID=A0A645H7Q1_9ZZZZ
MERLFQVCRDELLGDARTDKFLVAEHLRDAVHLLQLVAQLPHLVAAQAFIHHNKVGGRHIKIFFQPVGAHHAHHVLWHAVRQRVVHRCFRLCHGKRDDQHRKYCQQYPIMPGHKPRRVGKLWDQHAVRVFFHIAAEHQNQRGQNGNGAQYAQKDALCHNNTDIAPNAQPHKAQCQKAGDRGQRAAADRRECVANGMYHRVLI